MDVSEALKSEEGKAAIAAAVEEATKALKVKIEEFKTEKQRLKEEKDAIEAARQQAEEEAATKSGDVEKIKQQLETKHKKEFEAMQAKADGLNAKLNQVLVEQGLTDALSKAGVAPQFMDAARALIKTTYKPEISEQEGNPVAVIEGKTINEFVSGWSQGDGGKHFIAAPANGGGGARGSNTNPGGKGAKRSEMSHVDKASYIRDHGQEAYNNLPE